MQDGAGRIGKMVFARHGKKFDCDLKQVILQLWQQFSISLFVNVFSLVEHWIPVIDHSLVKSLALSLMNHQGD